MTKRHVLVLIHGITPQREPDVMAQYREFMVAVQRAALPIEPPACLVSWGVPNADGTISRPDQYLTPAEAAIATLVQSSSAEPHVDWGIPGLRQGISFVREHVVQYGLSDAIYYASPEGERWVRDTVFDQVFSKLEQRDGEDVVLHIVAHSLGVTVAHDFLYALFGSKDPLFPDQSDDSQVQFKLHGANRILEEKWRDAARGGRLHLGTFISFASQLPLFVLRKQALVKQFAEGYRLDPRVIGIDTTRERVQWAIFYDTDELLGFATSKLYEKTPAIQDINMNSGLDPYNAHVGYWRSRKIIDRAIDILRANMR